MMPRRLGHVERAPQVDVEDRVEQLGRHVVERLVPQDAGVVDHDVDGAERVDRGLHDGLAALGRGHAVGVGHRLAAEVVDLLGGLVGRALLAAVAADRAAEVVDDDPGAAPGELEGVLAAEAAARAGDDRDLAVVADVCHVLPRFVVEMSGWGSRGERREVSDGPSTAPNRLRHAFAPDVPAWSGADRAGGREGRVDQRRHARGGGHGRVHRLLRGRRVRAPVRRGRRRRSRRSGPGRGS